MNSKKRKYKQYMRSIKWRRKRLQRIKIDDYTCTCGCGIQTSIEQLDVHHISYDNFGNEKMGDLRTLLRGHHWEQRMKKWEEKEPPKEELPF